MVRFRVSYISRTCESRQQPIILNYAGEAAKAGYLIEDRQSERIIIDL